MNHTVESSRHIKNKTVMRERGGEGVQGPESVIQFSQGRSIGGLLLQQCSHVRTHVHQEFDTCHKPQEIGEGPILIVSSSIHGKSKDSTWKGLH